MRSAKIQLSLTKNEHGWSNPVVPGDHPDPTIIRFGGEFWASATSGEWSPQFPLFRSADLMRWQPAGAIFPRQPGWAEGSFWAPELVHDEVSGRFFVWYVARKRGGPLCIALATAPSPEGPYLDHGPLVCQELGSIDPCFARDEHGEPFLIWKEDGNSQGKPTPIWAQPLSDDLMHLTGEKTQLIVGNQPWEGGLVEGPYILRHELRFYLFYAGNSCCGRECKYAEGVARSDRLLGPWEKFPGNPLIGANDRWRCPGHGTAVQVGGETPREYLLYHAYPEASTIFVGREAILDEITWTEPEADGRPGWPVINAGRGPDGESGDGSKESTPEIDFSDNFTSPVVGPSWQWPVNTLPYVAIRGGALTLGIPHEAALSEKPVESAMIAVPRPPGTHYVASVLLTTAAPAEPALWAGLAIVGDPFNTIGLGLRGVDRTRHELILWQRRGDRQAVIWRGPAPAASVSLRVATLTPEQSGWRDADAPHLLQFSYSADGEAWTLAGPPYDATDLPAWDRGLRIGLMLEGPQGYSAEYREFRLQASSRSSAAA